MYILDPLDVDRGMVRTSSETRVLDESPNCHACLSIESLKDGATFGLFSSEHIMGVLLFRLQMSLERINHSESQQVELKPN